MVDTHQAPHSLSKPAHVPQAASPRQRIAFVFSRYWKDYYSSSPFYGFLFTGHPDIDVIEFDAHVGTGAIAERLMAGSYIGVLFCEAAIPHFDTLDLPRLVVTDDLHRFFKNYSRSYYRFHERDGILADYALTEPIDEFPLSMSEQVRRRTIYLPNYAMDKPCRRPHAERKPLVIAGALHEAGYPMRSRMADKLADLQPVPGRRELREGFIDVLGEHRVGLTDDVRFGSVVAKYFEIPMAGTLLIAPEPHSQVELLMLGFTADNSMLLPRDRLYDDAYVEKLVRGAVADIASTEAMALAGQQLVRRRHTVEARVRYLWLIFHRMHHGNWSVRDQFDLFLASERAEDARLDGGRPHPSAQLPGRLLIDVRSDYRHDAVAAVIGPQTEHVTLVVPTATIGRRLISQLAEERANVGLEWLLTDRTRVERLSAGHGAVLHADGDGIVMAAPLAERSNWRFGEWDEWTRLMALEFWRGVRGQLADRFGDALIRITEDENFDWTHGGVDLWLWRSRTHVVRARIEGILTAQPIMGILRPDGGSAAVGSFALSRFERAFGKVESSEHWQAYTPVTEYERVAVEYSWWPEYQAHLAAPIGDILRFWLDEVCTDGDPHAPM